MKQNSLCIAAITTSVLIFSLTGCNKPELDMETNPKVQREEGTHTGGGIPQQSTVDHLPASALAAKNAFLALKTKQYQQAIDTALPVVTEQLNSAMQKQEELVQLTRHNTMNVPPTGTVKEDVFKTVMKNGVINDVGACCVILGTAYRASGKQEDARKYFEIGSKLTMARCWDPNNDDPSAGGWNPTGWLWDTAEKCKAELR